MHGKYSLFNFISVLLLPIISIVSSFDYPKTKKEREIEEMGSLLDSDGFIFNSTIEASNSTYAKTGNVNKYLYDATMEILSFVPIKSKDDDVGVVISEWYQDKKRDNEQLKIIVNIKGATISAMGLDVSVTRKIIVKGEEKILKDNSSLANNLENQIIRKARQIYNRNRL